MAPLKVSSIATFGPGLSFVESTAITPEGRGTPQDLGLWDDAQIQPLRELVEYTARSLPEEERQAFIRPFQDVLKTAEGSKPLSEDDERRAKLLGMLLKEIKGLGEGTDKGSFNYNLLLLHRC